MGLLAYFNTKDNFGIQRLTFTHLWATIWKLCVTSVKLNSCLQFTPLWSRSTEVRTPVYMQFYSPTCGGPAQTNVELQVLMCIIDATTVSRRRSHSFYSALPLIAWVMLFLTFLCDGVFRTQWTFCLTPSDTFSGQTGTSSCRWIRSAATSQLPGGEPQWVLCLPAFLSAHRRLQQQHLEACASLQRR